MLHFIYQWFGVGRNGTPNTAYSFWSGVGSCLTYLALFGALWRHFNCHTRGCWRVGKHQVEGTPYKVCRHHHPDIPNKGASAEHIRRAHKVAQTNGR